MRRRYFCSLICCIVLFSTPIVPIAQTSHSAKVLPTETGPIAPFLRDMSVGYVGEGDDLFGTEIKKVEAALARESKNSAMLIDQTGNDRELIIAAAAAKVASGLASSPMS